MFLENTRIGPRESILRKERDGVEKGRSDIVIEVSAWQCLLGGGTQPRAHFPRNEGRSMQAAVRGDPPFNT